MPHSEKHVQRLLRDLKPRLPEAAEEVLERSCFWDPGFCDLFLGYCDDLVFSDPQAGLQIALVGTRLAQAMPEGSDPETRREQRERVILAYLVLGMAYRCVTRYEKADGAYRAAFDLCRRGVSGSCWAELEERLAYLRACQGRIAEAVRLAESAEGRFNAAEDEAGAGRAAVVHGAILIRAEDFGGAAAVLSKAMARYRLDERGEFTANHNLACAVSEADDPDCLQEATGHLLRARQLLGPRRSVQKFRLYWLDGKIHLRLGKMDKAEKLYRKAREGLIHFGVPYSIALVSLDLSALLRFARRWPELEELAADTYRRFRELGEDEEALAALKLWLEAAQARTLSEELIAEVKETVERRMTGPAAAVGRR